jgi:hypothetical protein
LALSLSGCGPPGPDRQADQEPGAGAGSNRVEGPRQVFRVHTPAARNQVILVVGADRVRVTLAGEGEGGGPLAVFGYAWGSYRRYEAPGSRPIAKARTSGSSIVLASPQDEVLWRITRRGRRLRIGAGRHDPEPFIIARASEHRLLVRRGGEVLGRVQFEGGRLKIRNARGEVLFVARGARLEPFYGVLLLTEIPADHRAVLLAEVARWEGSTAAP